jgi:hypothetical protein
MRTKTMTKDVEDRPEVGVALSREYPANAGFGENCDV